MGGGVQRQPRASWGAVNSPVNTLCIPWCTGSWEKSSNMCHLQAQSHGRLIKCFLAAIQGKEPGYRLTPSSVLNCLIPASRRRLVPETTLSCFPEINLVGTLVLSTHIHGRSLQKNPASISVWMWLLAETGGQPSPVLKCLRAWRESRQCLQPWSVSSSALCWGRERVANYPPIGYFLFPSLFFPTMALQPKMETHVSSPCPAY